MKGDVTLQNAIVKELLAENKRLSDELEFVKQSLSSINTILLAKGIITREEFRASLKTEQNRRAKR